MQAYSCITFQFQLTLQRSTQFHRSLQLDSISRSNSSGCFIRNKEATLFAESSPRSQESNRMPKTTGAKFIVSSATTKNDLLNSIFCWRNPSVSKLRWWLWSISSACKCLTLERCCNNFVKSNFLSSGPDGWHLHGRGSSVLSPSPREMLSRNS